MPDFNLSAINSLWSLDIQALINQLVTYTLIGLGAWSLLRLILRGGKLRYWKINTRIKLLQENNRLLTQILQQLQHNNASTREPSVPHTNSSQGLVQTNSTNTTH